MRLFTAVDLPVAMQQTLAERCFGLPRIRWQPPEQLHLTLVFIGEVNPAQKLDIVESLEGVDFPPFELHCQGIGSFRSGVLWLGVEAHPALLALQKRILQALRQEAGLELPGRRYRPHITLGRMDRQHPPQLEHFIAHNSQDRFSFEVREFRLKSSLLTPDGARHRTEQVFKGPTRVRPRPPLFP